MRYSFEAGQFVIFHGTVKGKRYVRIRGKAEEAGVMGVAQRFRVRIKIGVVRVPGNQIYGVERMS